MTKIETKINNQFFHFSIIIAIKKTIIIFINYKLIQKRFLNTALYDYALSLVFTLKEGNESLK